MNSSKLISLIIGVVLVVVIANGLYPTIYESIQTVTNNSAIPNTTVLGLVNTLFWVLVGASILVGFSMAFVGKKRRH